MAELALLWHLHQPDYRHPASGYPVMPWVRLHALRGYRDLCLDTLENEAAATINLVPSLLDQLLAYAEGQNDDHELLTSRQADALNASERQQIEETFICGNPTMIEIHPDYHVLAQRVRAGERLNLGDLRDLQVWSTLAWFGSTAIRDFPILAELRAKGRMFTEEEKRSLLTVQRDILAKAPELLRRVARSGHAEISVSPYFHPILPLLIDTRHARRCMPDLLEERRFSWPEDAYLQLTRARERLAEVFGVRPAGLWPSEGSVSPEVIELASRAGFSWIATDEGILHRSEADRGRGPGPWALGHGISGFFRDRELSDRIGFDYAKREGRSAAVELLSEVERRAQGGVVTIALDGENPWEAFPDAGSGFRSALYQSLRTGPVRGVVFSEVARREPVGRVRTLHTGSWIRSDFSIWIGHPDDRRAWSLLSDARLAIERASPELRSAALEKLLPAQGSDWMWWLGDEFSTPYAGTFDALFRAHLRAVWETLGLVPPVELNYPVATTTKVSVCPPVSPVSPIVGQPPSWAQWAGAGSASWSEGAMARGTRHARSLRFGWSDDGRRLWLLVELERGSKGTELDAKAWRFDCGSESIELAMSEARRDEDHASAYRGPDCVMAAFNFAAPPEGSMAVQFAVRAENDSLIRYPSEGPVLLPCDCSTAWWV